MDRTHAEEVSGWYHETSLLLEPPREKKKRQGEKHLAPRPPGRHKEGVHHLEPIIV